MTTFEATYGLFAADISTAQMPKVLAKKRFFNVKIDLFVVLIF